MHKHWPLHMLMSDNLPLDLTWLITDEFLYPVGKRADASKQIERSGPDKLPAATGQDLADHGISNDFGIDKTAESLLDDGLVDTEQRGPHPGWVDGCSVHVWCVVKMLELLRQTCHARMPACTGMIVSIELGSIPHSRSTQSSAMCPLSS